MKWHPPYRPYYALEEWEPWFAWRPVRAKRSSGTTEQEYNAPWRWAWLEWVERRYDRITSYETAYYEYREGCVR